MCCSLPMIGEGRASAGVQQRKETKQRFECDFFLNCKKEKNVCCYFLLVYFSGNFLNCNSFRLEDVNEL